MTKAIIIFLLTVSCALSSVAARVRMYICESNEVKFTLRQIPAEQKNDIRLEINGRVVYIPDSKIEEEKEAFIVLSSSSPAGMFTFNVGKPSSQAAIMDSDDIAQFEEEPLFFLQITNYKSNLDYSASCMVFDFDESVFDVMPSTRGLQSRTPYHFESSAK